MERQLLHENWKMRQVSWTQWDDAVVPGTVYTDMLRNKRMDNPFWKDNENKAVELMEEDYEYVCHFNCPEEMLA